jgi:hypothetical protein
MTWNPLLMGILCIFKEVLQWHTGSAHRSAPGMCGEMRIKQYLKAFAPIKAVKTHEYYRPPSLRH